MQKNINFGSFPDDPSADAIRTAFDKAQQNFNEVYKGLGQAGVQSINRVAGAGISVNSPTGNVQISANIANVRMQTSSLKMGVGSNAYTSADLSRSSQTIYIDLPDTIRTGNIALTGNAEIAGNISVGGTAVISSSGYWIGPEFGASGSSGFSGSVGSTGAPGASGFSGSVGSTGAPGASGFSGSVGSTGAPGASGFSGFSGSGGSSVFNTAFTHDLATSSNGTYATGILTFTGQPLDGQEIAIGRWAAMVNLVVTNPIAGATFDINGRTYTMQDTLTNVDGHIKLGASDVLTAQNIVAAINLSGVPGVDYAADMTINSDVVAITYGSNTLLIAAKVAGPSGDAITASPTFGALAFSNPTLAGGTGPDPYIFQTTLTDVARHVQIGVTTLESFENLVAAITLATGAGTKYASATTLNTEVSAEVLGSTVVVTAKAPWLIDGNNVRIESTVSGATWNGMLWNGNFLSGGTSITFGYFGGRMSFPAGNDVVTNGTLDIMDNTTTYVYAQSGDRVFGDILNTQNDFLFAEVTTLNGNITNVVDLRAPFVAFSDYNSGSIKLGQGPRPGGYNQIAIGFNAVRDAAGGSGDNVALGNNNMQTLTDGQYNVGIGPNALPAITIGSKNIGIGHDVLTGLTTGWNNIGIGSNSTGQALTTENNNVIIGGNNGTDLIGKTGQLIIADGAGNIKFSSIGESLQLGDVSTTFGTVKIGNQTLAENLVAVLPVDPLSHNPATTANGFPNATYGYNAGNVRSSNGSVLAHINAGTISIAANTTNWIYVDPSTRNVSVSTTTPPRGAFVMAEVPVDVSGNILNVIDHRAWANIEMVPLTSQVFSHVATGAAAGANITVPGIGTDITFGTPSQLVLVLEHVYTGGFITDIVDLTSEFTITPWPTTNTITNAGGTDTTGNKLLIQWLNYGYK